MRAGRPHNEVLARFGLRRYLTRTLRGMLGTGEIAPPLPTLFASSADRAGEAPHRAHITKPRASQRNRAPAHGVTAEMRTQA
jgi:hypothetical protein